MEISRLSYKIEATTCHKLAKNEKAKWRIRMPERIILLTDWLNIGTSGPTVDGRMIKPEWLRDAAKTYDPNEYTAVANAEHWYGNYGSARKLRTIKDDKDRTVLQAKISPNANYLAQNAEDKRLFFSMELTHDFAKTGKTYLTGLATTDRPASLGTSEVHFSRTDNKEVFRGGSEEFSATALQVIEEQKNEFIPAIVAAVKEVFASHKTKNPNKEELEMTEEQMSAFNEGQKAISDSVAALVTLLTPTKEDAPETTKATAKTSKEEFETLTGAVEKISASMEKLSADFKDAAEGKFGKETPASEGGENDATFV